MSRAWRRRIAVFGVVAVVAFTARIVAIQLSGEPVLSAADSAIAETAKREMRSQLPGGRMIIGIRTQQVRACGRDRHLVVADLHWLWATSSGYTCYDSQRGAFTAGGMPHEPDGPGPPCGDYCSADVQWASDAPCGSTDIR